MEASGPPLSLVVHQARSFGPGCFQCDGVPGCTQRQGVKVIDRYRGQSTRTWYCQLVGDAPTRLEVACFMPGSF